jgi:hypothetical protein
VFDKAWWMGVSGAFAGELIFAAALAVTRKWWLPAWRSMSRTAKVVTVVVVVTVVLAIATPGAGWWPSITRGAQRAWCALVYPVTLPLVVLLLAIPALIIAPLLLKRLWDRWRRRREFQPDAIHERILRRLGELDGRTTNSGEISAYINVGAIRVNQALEGMKAADIIWWHRSQFGQRLGLTNAGQRLVISRGYAPEHQH